MFTMTLRTNWEDGIFEAERLRGAANKRIKEIRSLIMRSEVVEETEDHTVYRMLETE